MCQSLLRPEDLKICLHVWTGKFKDYYVTSLFLFLNISVVFSQEGSMVVFLGSLGWMLLPVVVSNEVKSNSLLYLSKFFKYLYFTGVVLFE